MLARGYRVTASGLSCSIHSEMEVTLMLSEAEMVFLRNWTQEYLTEYGFDVYSAAIHDILRLLMEDETTSE